jgi:hypothetical protein
LRAVVVFVVEVVFVTAVVAAVEDEVVLAAELLSTSTPDAALSVEFEAEGPLTPRKAEPTSTPTATVAEIATLIFVYVFAAISCSPGADAFCVSVVLRISSRLVLWPTLKSDLKCLMHSESLSGTIDAEG